MVRWKYLEIKYMYIGHEIKYLNARGQFLNCISSLQEKWMPTNMTEAKICYGRQIFSA
jgi:hypothetical protein